MFYIHLPTHKLAGLLWLPRTSAEALLWLFSEGILYPSCSFGRVSCIPVFPHLLGVRFEAFASFGELVGLGQQLFIGHLRCWNKDALPIPHNRVSYLHKFGAF